MIIQVHFTFFALKPRLHAKLFLLKLWIRLKYLFQSLRKWNVFYLLCQYFISNCILHVLDLKDVLEMNLKLFFYLRSASYLAPPSTTFKLSRFEAILETRPN